MPTVHVSSHSEFTKAINGSKLVVVDFHATWCGPCKAIAPRFEKLSNEVTNVTFLKVDVDEHQSIARECSVTAMPTFQLYRNGKKLEEVVGADINTVERLVRKHASSSSSTGFPSSGGRVLGSGAPVAGGAGGGGGGMGQPKDTSYLLWGLAIGLLAYLFLTRNDPEKSGMSTFQRIYGGH
ncbi:Cytoplasmic thioredoxin isoenzyme 2 [Rhizophlyctis rosea]|nr:Cytoplasmic thioredoxin isoenzyme 2 [Rhizophlyctis rosea]